jgi:hypothetical protein
VGKQTAGNGLQYIMDIEKLKGHGKNPVKQGSTVYVPPSKQNIWNF